MWAVNCKIKKGREGGEGVGERMRGELPGKKWCFWYMTRKSVESGKLDAGK